VLRLRKALYGLKQAPRIWYLLLSETIISMGFQVLETDNCIYIREGVIIAVFVDDILIAGPNENQCNTVASDIACHFDITVKGPVKSFLGLSITRHWDHHAITISQPAYIDYLIAKYKLNDA
jgi:Reverse transcriptase (RNA-dependent DNA polymerase)